MPTDPCVQRVLDALQRAYREGAPLELDVLGRQVDACWYQLDALQTSRGSDDGLTDAKTHLTALAALLTMLRNTLLQAAGEDASC